MADEDDGDACDTNNSSPSYIMRQLHDQLVQPNRTDGALRSGGVISLWNRSHVGLVISSVLAGFMLGALPSTIVSLKVQARVATTAQLLGPAFSPIYGLSSPVMFFPASLRFSFGLVSDIFPIYGSHRMPYMLMGWAASFVSFLIGGLLLSTSVIQEPSLLLMLIACSGVTMADVAGDGLLVELAQREPVAFRGRTQGIVLAFKFLGVALSQAYIAVLEGSLFTQWTPSDPNYLGLIYSLAMLSVVPTPFVYFLATSRHPPGALPTSLTTSSPRASFLDNVIALWTCLQSKAIAAYLLFSFLFSLAIHVGNGGTSVFKREVLDVWIERSWLHHGDANVAPRQSLFVVGAGAIVFGLAMVAVTKRRWKAALAWSTIAIGVVGSLHASCTVYGTSRVPWFWYGTLLVLQVPHGIRHIVSLLPVVEYAPVGFEATMSSLAMSVQLVAVPIVTAVYSTTLQDTLVNVLEADTASITPSVQTQVGDLMALGPLASFGVFVSLIWLPNSPVEAQVWRWGGGQSPGPVESSSGESGVLEPSFLDLASAN
ncbi:hypothetical protein DYB32_007871 [Aphanomyces invadans]|uniref:Major facilitator superfamily (MFS) profile domain-containing protein n=1 Tax=Aphanomyces invadans TaxID=157072 RepID=A0A418AMV9_9STRA|nr:hypothetical protein DYB32_007871 [Aphanomyces invadans]